MNRLIIIENGFDLAHGLPTSYKHFIESYWSSIENSNYKDDFLGFVIQNIFFKKAESIESIVEQYKCSQHYEKLAQLGTSNVFHFSNEFFKRICAEKDMAWVDIENKYYAYLKHIVKNSSEENLNLEAKRLNDGFEIFKRKFENYLKSVVSKSSVHSNTLMEELFANRVIFNENELLDFKKELEVSYIKEFDENIKQHKSNHRVSAEYELFRFKMGYVLNFNYTNTCKSYFEKTRFINRELINIHGQIHDAKNPINFGFGDEMDDNYRDIENTLDGELLRFIKSFQYLNNDNYYKLLEFLNRDSFQIQLMGHSCGVSDRVLLNTIFEHKNCKSIKVFYHQKEDGSDNYTDIVQNISRHFKDKKLMRERIVNKELCSPLPQWKN